MGFHAKNGTVTLSAGEMDYIRFGSGPRALVKLPGCWAARLPGKLQPVSPAHGCICIPNGATACTKKPQTSTNW